MNNTTAYLKENVSKLLFTASLIEGIGCTLAQTEQIIESGTCEGLTPDDITKIINFKHSLEFLLDEVGHPVELGTLADYNAILGEDVFSHPNPGYIRDDQEAQISNCAYTAPPISVDDALDVVNGYHDYDDPLDQGAYLALNISKSQLFYDGNKRTSLLAYNHILCYNDCGVLFMLNTKETYTDYIKLLLSFYTGETSLETAMEGIKEFLQ